MSDTSGKRGPAAAAGGAAGLSALASAVGLCCIGPWAVALFGVSGAVAMARWQPLRPWILGAAALLLAWAFWRVYRPPPCSDERCVRRTSPWLKAALWLSLALLVTAFFAEDLQWILVDPTPEGLRE